MLYNDKMPNGPDPDRYILVVTREGRYWRKKRGSIKKAEPNVGFRRSADLMKISAPAASRIVTKLRYYTEGLDTGRLSARISSALRKKLGATGSAGISCLKGMELQPYHPIHHLLQTGYVVNEKNGMLEVSIRLSRYTIKKNSGIVSHYFFELVLLYGDCMEDNSLRTEEVSSGVYPIEQHTGVCTMEMVLPEKEWIALLKVSCIEGKEMAVHPKNYGMKVIAAGSK
jgi:hypothetical protein